MKKNNFRKHFRRGKTANKGHPTYIYAKEGDTLKFIGITHSEITEGVKNIELEKNPNPEDKRKSFIRPNLGEDKLKKFGSRLPNWSFDKKDKDKVKKVIRISKKKK